jgi:glycosyltransferase involved in cell wall biosynthesis
MRGETCQSTQYAKRSIDLKSNSRFLEATRRDQKSEMSRKRILMVAPTPYFSDRGCHVQIYEVARSQQLNGNSVVIVTYHLGRDIGEIPTYRIPPVPWYRKRSAGPSWHKLYLDFLLMIRVLQVARQYKPHIIHAHLHEGAGISIIIARMLRIPVLLDLQGSLVGEMVNHKFVREGSMPYLLFRKLEQQIIWCVDGILMWNYISEALQKLFTFDPKKVFNVSYGVDLQNFRPHKKEDLCDLYENLKIERDRVVIVYLGVLSSYQGIDLLIDSIPRVLKSLPNAYFLIMGYPDEEYYRAKARDLGVSERVCLPGRIDYAQAARYLSLGDVAVAPKLTPMEGNGKLLNYMACALPTVAFDLPGNIATLADTGVYAVTGDVQAFADRIITLGSDPHLRSDLGKRARERAERYFSWSRIGREINDIYDILLSRKESN